MPLLVHACTGSEDHMNMSRAENKDVQRSADSARSRQIVCTSKRVIGLLRITNARSRVTGQQQKVWMCLQGGVGLPKEKTLTLGLFYGKANSTGYLRQKQNI